MAASIVVLVVIVTVVSCAAVAWQATPGRGLLLASLLLRFSFS